MLIPRSLARLIARKAEALDASRLPYSILVLWLTEAYKQPKNEQLP
jgi:hypothetical protein